MIIYMERSDLLSMVLAKIEALHRLLQSYWIMISEARNRVNFFLLLYIKIKLHTFFHMPILAFDNIN